MSLDDGEITGVSGPSTGLRPSGQGDVLAVDLDGTLIDGDLFYESFWAGFARDWWQPLRAIEALRRGRAVLKRALAERTEFDAARLPYNEVALDWVRAWRDAGGRTALVTASDQILADQVAEHLGLFDEVHGSDGETNLKGTAKAEFLVQRYGAGGFAYMGDSAPDLNVWEQAGAVISVGARPGFRRRIEALGKPVEHIPRPGPRIAVVLEALRPHQWLKNILVFVPMVASQNFTMAGFTASLIAFLAMCLVASGGYMLNDLLDLADDRTHPRKRNRPMASGRMPVQIGTLLVPSMLAAGLSLAAMVSTTLAFVILIYFCLTMAYSVKLKQFALIDVFLLAVLYTSRIVAGAIAIWVEPSIWLLAFSMFFFLSLAGVKRQAELIEAEAQGARAETRRGYRVEDRSMVTQMAVAAGYAAVVVLALYLNDPSVQAQYSTPRVLWLVPPLLLYWVSRMVLTAGRGGMHDDPLVYAVKDRGSQLVLALLAILVCLAIFL